MLKPAMESQNISAGGLNRSLLREALRDIIVETGPFHGLLSGVGSPGILGEASLLSHSIVRSLLSLLLAAAATCSAQPAAVVQDQSHRSQVMGSARAYRVYLPSAYATAKATRYPVIYWLHGYEPENETRDAAIAAWVATHAAIVVDSGPADKKRASRSDGKIQPICTTWPAKRWQVRAPATARPAR